MFTLFTTSLLALSGAPELANPDLSESLTWLRHWAAQCSSFAQRHETLLNILVTCSVILIGQWFTSRRSEKRQRHDLELVSKRGEVQLERSLELAREQAKLSHEREVAARLRQAEELETAERLLVQSYIDLLVPRLDQITTIFYLSRGNRDEEERRRFAQLATFMESNSVDPAHPQRNLSLRMTFLLFQLCAAIRIALDARWSRALTPRQHEFLAEWDLRIEPVLCSTRYPGDPFLYREQLELVVNLMIIRTERAVLRPLDWREFVAALDRCPELKEISTVVGKGFRRVFDETIPAPPRRAEQCRLAILGLYLIHFGADNGSWSRQADGFWDTTTEWFRWQHREGQKPDWFVFERGDVRGRA
jgi:hypothetical protein